MERQTSFSKRILSIMLSLIMVLSLLYLPSGLFGIDFGLKASAATIDAVAPTTGDGTAENPYQISSKEELYWFASAASYDNTDINAVLVNDITVNDGVLDADGNLNSGEFDAWTPIGDSYSPYVGTFDGAGYTVSGLYLNDSSAELVGLFGYVGENGTVRNVGVVDSYFSADKYVGGVCGRSGGTITNCYADVTVNGSQCIGGVCGHNRGIIANCYSTSMVSGTTLYGGVCGFLINGTIVNCYYDKTKFTGNAVGYQTDDYTVTNVNGITPAQLESGEVAYKLSQGCKVGSVTYDGSIWGQEIGKDTSPVLGGKKVYATTGCISYNNDGNEGEKEHSFENGICTDCGRYRISNAAELASFAAAVNGGNIEINAILTADITVNEGVLDADGNLNSGEFDTWTPIGDYDNPYNGTFDGQNHTISGLYFNASNVSNIGLFGYVGEYGTVCNVGVVESYFNGEYGIGGVCTSNEGTVTNCFVRGTLSGGSDVGGLCSWNDGTVSNCYAVVTVSAEYYCGALCGYNGGTITNCCFYGGSAIYENSGDSDNVFSKTTAQFKSGEVAYLLNQNDENADDVWGQTIGTDDYPVLGGANVYATKGCV
ncbi:MAG: GLUG motif-containing protein, partial [Acutalibacteraceae bacterium]